MSAFILELGLAVVALGFDACQRVGGGAGRGVVLVERPLRVELATSSLGDA